ncbi:MAG TPA: hypothetical protein VFQ61_20990 [Polyangiaceae bacterium]|nr:hypothetical protein [Polyangiaceae bacterium]
MLLLTALCLLTPARRALADACIPTRGQACTTSSTCSGAASACINSSCQVPCGVVPSGQLDERPLPNLCSIGESCVAGTAGAKQRYFCKPTPFRMDLNLLDSCIYHFVQGVDPAIGAGNECSVMRQLTNLLDQDGDSSFDIYDVDLCIKSFLGDPPCDVATQTCPNQQTYCAADAACGEGLFCNQQMHRCERECGFIVDRDFTNVPKVDRVCAGRLEACNYERGRCAEVSLEGATCQLDRDCPVGAYCLVGQCQPRCYRTLDCPDSNWFCSVDNTCLPKPKGPATGEPFNPKDYSIVYAFDNIALDPFQNQYSVPLLIMNLKTGKQVFADPKVVFGYRLEAKYERKEDARCSGDLTQLTTTQKEDCIVSPDEEFLTLGNPFGSLYAEGDPSTFLRVNDAGANKLSPGSYPVNLTAYFSNGKSTTVRVTFKKPSPSGEYAGRMSAYLGSPEALLSTTNVAMRLYVKTKEEDTNASLVTWSSVLAANNLTREPEFEDLTEGYPVEGYIHAGESLVFDKPTATVAGENEVPVKGLYSPQLGRMRLVAVVELPKNYCRNSAGQPCTGAADEWRADSAFGRDIRRIIEFIGPFKPAQRLFEGMYRETISGLMPNAFTVEGGFRITQVNQDSRALNLTAPLIAAEGRVQFPDKATLVQTLKTSMEQACGASVANQLATKAAVDAYLTSYGSAPPAFPGVRFEDRIQNAINTVHDATATLTLTEFLTGQVLFCSSTVTTNCVDQKQLACGLSFFRRAILEAASPDSLPDSDPNHVPGWFDREALGRDSAGHELAPPLFCNRSSTPGQNTCADPNFVSSRGAVMFQDHMRFYRELTQTYTYQANAAWSDAFHALYKASERADALGQAGAFAYKEGKLREVLRNYDAVRTEMLGPVASGTLFNWPMQRFQGQGDAWIKQMQTVLKDRLDAWIELADLKRRVLRTADLEKSYTFAKHVIHQEYLTQVFLAELQRRWQGLNFQYAGQSLTMLNSGDVFLAKLSDSRNPLGLSPDRVYFENSTPGLTNWQNYKTLVDERVTRAKGTVQTAIANLHDALESKIQLDSGLMQTAQGRDASLDDICGPPGTTEPSCRLDPSDKELATACVGPNCPYQWSCDAADESGRCSNVVKLFSSAVDNVSCRSDIDSKRYDVRIGKDSTTGAPIMRSCDRGRVGGLLQERVKLDLQRKQAKDKVESLLRQIAREEQELADTRASNSQFIEYLNQQRTKFLAAESGVAVAEAAYEAARIGAESVSCLVIIGFANGTDCPQRGISAALQIAATAAKYAVVPALNIAMSDMSRAKEIAYQERSADAEVRQLRLRLDNMVAEVENIIAEYQLLIQQLYSLDMQISDTVKTAQRTADRYAEQTNDVIKRLLGNDSSQTLRSNQLVRAADAEFQNLLVFAYKMTRAFLHRYNYADQAEVWTNRVYQLITIADVEKLVTDLVEEERRYCGSQGIDCDSINGRQVMRFSVRDQLFPQLSDIVDPTTGRILFKGEQFHNLITSSAFRHRRVVQGVTLENIELPFSIWANDLGTVNGAPQPVMLPRGSCNHIVAADRSDGAKTFAANVMGTRLEVRAPLRYELIRGGTDQIRRCDPGGVFVSTFKVDYPLVNSSTQRAFQTRTGPLEACTNNFLLEQVETRDQPQPCWNPFARDRSLAAPDWILSIPLDGQQWVVGIDDATGAPISDSEKPIVENFVLYFRYNARPSN